MILRLFYRNWRPTRMGRLVNRLAGWMSIVGLAPKEQAVLELRGRTSGQPRSLPVVIATVEGKQYLVSMLGPESNWVKNVEAAHGNAILRQGRPHRVHLVSVPPAERAPILREYVRVRDKRSPPLPGGRRRATAGVPDHCGALSGVPDRSFVT